MKTNDHVERALFLRGEISAIKSMMAEIYDALPVVTPEDEEDVTDNFLLWLQLDSILSCHKECLMEYEMELSMIELDRPSADLNIPLVKAG